MDWYYKGGLLVGLVWATARVLGAYGEQARDLDINFLFGFLLTTGGWAAVFLVIDRVAKFLGWKRVAVSPAGAEVSPAPAPPPSRPASAESPSAAQRPSSAPARRRSSRRSRR
jgi:hypothetical protein